MKLKGMEKVADLLLVNLLFVICSIPIITVGASATAMYYVLGRIRRQEGTVARDFFRSFLENFRQATLYWCVLLASIFALCWNFWLISDWSGHAYSFAMVLLILTAWFAASWGSVVFPLLSRFENTMAATARNACMLVFVFPIRTIAAVLINAVPIALLIFLPKLFALAAVFWLLLFFSLGAYVVSLLMEPVFHRMEKSSEK